MTTTSAFDMAGPPARRRPFSMWLRFVLMLAVPPFVWWLATYDVLPHMKLCAFQLATGRPCPGCGMTRAMLRLSVGDVSQSLRMHPLGVLLAACFLAALAATAFGLVTGTDPVVRFLERRGARFTGALVVLLLAVWIVRAFIVPEWSPDPIR